MTEATTTLTRAGGPTARKKELFWADYRANYSFSHLCPFYEFIGTTDCVIEGGARLAVILVKAVMDDVLQHLVPRKRPARPIISYSAKHGSVAGRSGTQLGLSDCYRFGMGKSPLF